MLITALTGILSQPDVSYTRTPDYTKWRQYQPVTDFWNIAPLAYPEERRAAISGTTPRTSEALKVSLPPDEQLLCFDFLYYAGTEGVRLGYV